MKILLVHKFWRKLSGAEMYFHDVMRILKQKGHEVKVLTTNLNAEGSIDPKEENEDIFYGDAVDYLNGSLLKRTLNLPELIYSKKNKKIMNDILSDFKPDIVHVFAIYITLTPSILEACNEKGIPAVMSCNDYKHICTNYRLYHHGHVCTDCKSGKLYSSLLNNCCKHSIAFSFASTIEAYVHYFKNIYKKNITTFLFESKFMMEMTNTFWGKEKYHSRLIGKPFHSPAYEASYEYENYFLFVGRLSDEKGINILLKAMQYAPQTHLLIVGTGSESQNLEKLASELNLNNVEFAGAIWGNEVKQIMRKARFIVVPSIWYENFPYVITESYAMGKAVIGSDKGGIPENIDEGVTGHVYPAHDYHRLSEIIRMMWNNESDTVQKGINAKKYADENFNDSVFYEKLLNAYDHALQKS